jgi:hypothetical protein
MSLFDHLVRGDEQSLRYHEAKSLGGLLVDHQLEVGLVDRQIGCAAL